MRTPPYTTNPTPPNPLRHPPAPTSPSPPTLAGVPAAHTAALSTVGTKRSIETASLETLSRIGHDIESPPLFGVESQLRNVRPRHSASERRLSPTEGTFKEEPAAPSVVVEWLAIWRWNWRGAWLAKVNGDTHEKLTQPVSVGGANGNESSHPKGAAATDEAATAHPFRDVLIAESHPVTVSAKPTSEHKPVTVKEPSDLRCFRAPPLYPRHERCPWTYVGLSWDQAQLQCQHRMLPNWDWTCETSRQRWSELTWLVEQGFDVPDGLVLQSRLMALQGPTCYTVETRQLLLLMGVQVLLSGCEGTPRNSTPAATPVEAAIFGNQDKTFIEFKIDVARCLAEAYLLMDTLGDVAATGSQLIGLQHNSHEVVRFFVTRLPASASCQCDAALRYMMRGIARCHTCRSDKCAKSGENFRMCSMCKSVRYCSKVRRCDRPTIHGR